MREPHEEAPSGAGAWGYEMHRPARERPEGVSLWYQGWAWFLGRWRRV